ncbi:UNVERIFIED_CONTAM: hypothetical protein HHA_252870 [Hammondia hammondi]|eukprot:XP_008884925.1 hypothetical protein HHA_252870 [Hammondia hammondi]
MRTTPRLLRRVRPSRLLSCDPSAATRGVHLSFIFEDNRHVSAFSNADLTQGPISPMLATPCGTRRKLESLEQPTATFVASTAFARNPWDPASARPSWASLQSPETASRHRFPSRHVPLQTRLCSFSPYRRRTVRTDPLTRFPLAYLGTRVSCPPLSRLQGQIWLRRREHEQQRCPGRAARSSPRRALGPFGSFAGVACGLQTPLTVNKRESGSTASCFPSLATSVSRRFLAAAPLASLRERTHHPKGDVDRRGGEGKDCLSSVRKRERRRPKAEQESSDSSSSSSASPLSPPSRTSGVSIDSPASDVGHAGSASSSESAAVSSTAAASQTSPSSAWQNFAWLADEGVLRSRSGRRVSGNPSLPNSPCADLLRLTPADGPSSSTCRAARPDRAAHEPPTPPLDSLSPSVSPSAVRCSSSYSSSSPSSSASCFAPSSSSASSAASLASTSSGLTRESRSSEHAGHGDPQSPPSLQSVHFAPLDSRKRSDSERTGIEHLACGGTLPGRRESKRRSASARRNRKDETSVEGRQGRAHGNKLDEEWISKWRGRKPEEARALLRERWIRDLLLSRPSESRTAVQQELLVLLLDREKLRTRENANADRRRLSDRRVSPHSKANPTQFVFQNLRRSSFLAPPLLHGSRGLSLLFRALRVSPSSSASSVSASSSSSSSASSVSASSSSSSSASSVSASSSSSFSASASSACPPWRSSWASEMSQQRGDGEQEASGVAAEPPVSDSDRDMQDSHKGPEAAATAQAKAQIAHEVVRDLLYHLPHFSTSHIVTVLRLVSASLPGSWLAFRPAALSQTPLSTAEAFLSDPLDFACMPLGELRLELLAVLSRCVSPSWLARFSSDEFIGLLSFTQAVAAPSASPLSPRAGVGARGGGRAGEGDTSDEAARGRGDTGGRRRVESGPGAEQEPCLSRQRGSSPGEDEWERERNRCRQSTEMRRNTTSTSTRGFRRDEESAMKQRLRHSPDFLALLQRLSAALPTKIAAFSSLPELAVVAQNLSRLEALDALTLRAVGDRAGHLLHARRVGAEKQRGTQRQRALSADSPDDSSVSPCEESTESAVAEPPWMAKESLLRKCGEGERDKQKGLEREGDDDSAASLDCLLKEVKSAAVLCTLMGKLGAVSPLFQRELFLWVATLPDRVSEAGGDAETHVSPSRFQQEKPRQNERAVASAPEPGHVQASAFFRHSAAFLPAFSTCLTHSLCVERSPRRGEWLTEGFYQPSDRARVQAKTETGDPPPTSVSAPGSSEVAEASSEAIVGGPAREAFLRLVSCGLPYLDSPAQVVGVLRALARVARTEVMKDDLQQKERNSQGAERRRQDAPTRHGNERDGTRDLENLSASPSGFFEAAGVAVSPQSGCRPNGIVAFVQKTQLKALLHLRSLLLAGTSDSDLRSLLSSSALSLEAALGGVEAAAGSATREAENTPSRPALRTPDLSLRRPLLLALCETAEATRETYALVNLRETAVTGRQFRDESNAARKREGKGSETCAEDLATGAQERETRADLEKTGTPEGGGSKKAPLAGEAEGPRGSDPSFSGDLSFLIALLLYQVFAVPPFPRQLQEKHTSLLHWLRARPQDLQWSFPLALRCVAGALSLEVSQALHASLASSRCVSRDEPKGGGASRSPRSTPKRAEAHVVLNSRQEVSPKPALASGSRFRASRLWLLSVLDVVLDPSLSSLFLLRFPASHPSRQTTVKTASLLLSLLRSRQDVPASAPGASVSASQSLSCQKASIPQAHAAMPDGLETLNEDREETKRAAEAEFDRLVTRVSGRLASLATALRT